MNKRLIVISLMALLINGVLAYDEGFTLLTAKDEALIQAWSEFETSEVQMNLNVYGKINDAYSEKAEIEQVLQFVASSLGMPTEFEVAYTEYEAFCEGIVHHVTEEGIYIDIAVQTFADSSETIAETGIVINVDQCADIELMLKYKSLLEYCMSALEIDNQVHYTLLGKLIQVTNLRELMYLIERAMQAMQATPKDFYLDQNVLSISAFSPLIDSNYYGWDFNFQMSLRRNEEEGAYYIWLGFPAIGQSF